MDPGLGIFRHYRHFGSPVTFPIRANRGDRDFRPRTCRGPVSWCFLTFEFEQNQRNVYREVLITGDLSREDVKRAGAQFAESKVDRP